MMLTSGILMVGTKIALLSALFSNASFVYPVLTLLELIVAVAFFKAIRIPLEMFDNVLPSLISPSMLLIRSQPSKRRISKECFELVCISSLHFLNLILAYGPMFLIIQYSGYFNAYRSSHVVITHAAVLTLYLLSIVVYGLIHCIYTNYGTPWRSLKVVIGKKKKY